MKNLRSLLLTVPMLGILSLLAACDPGLNGNNPESQATTGDPANTVKALDPVAALFPLQGSDWNDYVVGGDHASATDFACDANVDSACAHGGELRVVEAIDRSSCAGLTAFDDLGVFEWRCDDSSGAARLISTGFADGFYLSDLLDFTAPGFLPNAVTVFDQGVTWGRTPGSAWWGNPVVVNNAGGSLADVSTVYVVTADPAEAWTLDADKVALVVEPGTTISAAGAVADLIHASGRNHLWLEASLDASADSRGIGLETVRFSTLRNVNVENAAIHGIRLKSNVSNSRFAAIRVSNSATTGFLITLSSANSFSSVEVRGNGSKGIMLVDSLANSLIGVIASDNGQSGIRFDNSANNRLTDVISSGNAHGVRIVGSSNNTFSNLRVADNRSDGVDIEASSGNSFTGVKASRNEHNGVILHSDSANNRFMDVIASNNTRGLEVFGASNTFANTIITSSSSQGLRVENGSDNLFSGLYSAGNGFVGVKLTAGSNNNRFSGVAAHKNYRGIDILDTTAGNSFENTASAGNDSWSLRLVNTSNNRFGGKLQIGGSCDVSGGTDPGLVHASCTNNGSSTATLIQNIELLNSVFGMVNTDDTQNVSDTSGAVADFPADPANFDWFGFDNDFRAWGKDTGFPKGKWGSGPGRIWDWSLLAADSGADTAYYASSGQPVCASLPCPALLDVVALPTGGDTSIHVWGGASVSQSDCDALMPGSLFNGAACETTYLRGAIEIEGDALGNENMLCESGETCLFQPNIGAYQGHGDLVSAGLFTDGALSGITLLRYEHNGR